jgi:ABC-type lipoprotein export system ATPase subunit
MAIVLQNIIPLHLEQEKIAQSAIWQHEVTFTVGEKIQIVAPSGSGKTTLVHFCYGIRNDFKGSLKINNKNSSTFSATDWASFRQNECSIIFQDLRLFAEHTVLQNIEIKQALNTYHSISKIKEMAERLGIANKLTQLAGTCSYGEQQRIAIIRALQQPFNFIIMDEPFSHLDDNNSKIAMQLIQEEADARGAAIILADLEKVPFFNADKTLHL